MQYQYKPSQWSKFNGVIGGQGISITLPIKYSSIYFLNVIDSCSEGSMDNTTDYHWGLLYSWQEQSLRTSIYLLRMYTNNKFIIDDGIGLIHVISIGI